MVYNLIFSNDFNSELNSVLDYISQNLDNPSAAKSLLSKVVNTTSLLKENPMLFPLYHNEKIAKQGFRYTVISNYLLFYKVNEVKQTVELLHFIFGERNIPDIF